MAERRYIAGFAVDTLPDGRVKIEGQPPMTRGEADDFLNRAARSRDSLRCSSPTMIGHDPADDDDPQPALEKDPAGGWRRVPLKEAAHG